MKTKANNKRRKNSATRRLMEALNRLIVAARQAEKARDDLLKEAREGCRDE